MASQVARMAALYRRVVPAPIGVLESGHIEVHYQPIVALSGEVCTAVEALVRWRDPERGLLCPAAFLDAAESTGVIVPLGTHVLRQACADAVGWPSGPSDRPPRVHVNVSARQLEDRRFTATVLDAVRDAGLAPNRLVLELTETALLDAPRAAERITRLARHGVVIALDDFGTGYSAFATLRHLPIGIIKIDQSFVVHLATNPHDRSLVAALAHMARELGIETVAEGVEESEQEQIVAAAAAGADAVQGHLHLRPVPNADLLAWFRARAATRARTTFDRQLAEIE